MKTNPEKTSGMVHGNGKFDCSDMANAIKALLGMVNNSGWIKQEAGGTFRQFKVSSVDSDQSSAVIRLEFAGQGFKLEITLDSKTNQPKG